MSRCDVHCPTGTSVLAAVPVVLTVGGGLWVLSTLGAMVPVAVPYILGPIALAFVVWTVVKTTRDDRARNAPEVEEHEPELIALPAPRKALPASPSAPEVPVAVSATGKTVPVIWRRNHP